MTELQTTPAGAVTQAGGSGAAWNARYSGAIMNTFGTPQRVLVRGEGAYVWDADGNRYLDLLGGIAVNVLGHAHPFLTSAITAQLATLGHVSNFFATAPQIALAERLLELAGAPEGSRIFFCNSGTEANEAAFKMARRTGRIGMVAAEGAFHGRTMGALALTHKPGYRAPFEPLPGDVVHVPFGDVEALRGAVGPGTAAVVLEPIQGEAGAVVPPAGYLAAAREIATAAGALLVLDEVQTGVGRTGAWFAHQHPRHGGAAGGVGGVGVGAVRPDVVTLAKGLRGGTTFGGNPVAAAAGLATLHVIERDGLLENARAIGDRITRALLAPAHPQIVDVRGEGLLLGIVLGSPVAVAVRDALMGRGFIVNAPGPDTLRIAPPLILTADQADSFVAALPAAIHLALDAFGEAQQ